MNHLKKGTLCVIIGGCPENLGAIVEVIKHLGKYGNREDAYLIKTVSGRKFNQLFINGLLTKGNSIEAVTDRHKLKPLPDNPIEGLEFNEEISQTVDTN